MGKRRWTAWIVMMALVLLAAGGAAVVHALTKRPAGDPYLTQAAEKLQALFPEADPDGFEAIPLPENSPADFACQARRGDALLGFAAAATMQGYGGPVQVLAALDPEGALRGIAVGNAAFAETQGIGSKAAESGFTDQFAGQRPPLTLGQEVQAVSGATITSRAVVTAVNRAAEALKGQFIATLPTESPIDQRRTANASVMGYAGPVLVQLALDDAGTINALQVGGARFLETEGVGSRVKDPAFTTQFMDKKPPLALGKDIDAVSGATISSQAVVDAVNAAYAFLMEEP